MPLPRKTETAAMARRICFAQGVIPCCLCGRRLLPDDKVIREHRHALALGGADEEENMGYAHEDCSAHKTNGTRATSYGSDKHAIAKAKRFDKINRGEVRATKKIPGQSLSTQYHRAKEWKEKNLDNR